jgi:hypothetical protein
MPVNNLTYNPLMTISIKAAASLPANRFVDFDGNLCSAAEAALGATEIGWNSGDTASLIVHGIAIVEAADSFFAGDDVCCGADGKAVTQSASNPVVGKALGTASTGGYLQVLLVH